MLNYEIKFEEIFNNFMNVINEKKNFLENYDFYKDKIIMLLESIDIKYNIFGIFLFDELSDSKKIDFIEQIFNIYIYKIGISDRAYKSLFFLDKKILLNQLKDIIRLRKYDFDDIEVGMILNFYKMIDLKTALFFCDFFRNIDDDINETINYFIESLNQIVLKN